MAVSRDGPKYGVGLQHPLRRFQPVSLVRRRGEPFGIEADNKEIMPFGEEN